MAALDCDSIVEETLILHIIHEKGYSMYVSLSGVKH